MKLNDIKTSEILSAYNELAGKSTKRFASRDKGILQLKSVVAAMVDTNKEIPSHLFDICNAVYPITPKGNTKKPTKKRAPRTKFTVKQETLLATLKEEGLSTSASLAKTLDGEKMAIESILVPLLDKGFVTINGRNQYQLTPKAERIESLNKTDDLNFKIADYKVAGPKSQFAGKRIHKLVEENPRREGTFGHQSFELIEEGMTFEDYKRKGGRNKDLKWDVDHGFVELK